ncbi:MAG: apolipoprotein N-acyltransferase [Niabella sp.]
MKLKYNNLLLAVLGPLLLWAAWPPLSLTFLLFVAWLPLLFIANSHINWKKFLGYTYLHMLLWNLLVTWWVAMSTIPGGISAFLANSLIMCIPWLFYFFIKKYFHPAVSLLALMSFWITYEYIHHNWDLSWPWLALGNAFAARTQWIQWYEYTGASGGTLWVLLANIFIFLAFKTYSAEGRSNTYFKYLVSFLIIICIPIGISVLVGKRTLTLHDNKYNVVVVQPNVDPWNEKFVQDSQGKQLEELIQLSKQQIDANTALVVWPETAIPQAINEDNLKENAFLTPVWDFLKSHPKINLLTGIEGYKHFDKKTSRFARPFPDGDGYYEAYNSAVLLDSNNIQIYHKSKLVPGVEVLPGFLNFMAPLFDKFGGTTSGYTPSDSAKVLHTTNNSFNITPAVCYESIYGDYLADFNRKHTDLICIITNDGWWGNTPGYRQHKDYARLRAIESRKWVARSANTGISCFIDPYGNVVQQLDWNKQGAIKQQVATFVTETFYTKYGDIISRFFSWFTIALLLLAIVLPIYKRRAK